MCRNIVYLCCLLCCCCVFATPAFAWHPAVKSVCKQQDGSQKVVFDWFGDGNTYKISAGNTGTTGSPNCLKNNSSDWNSSDCKNYFSPDPKSRPNQPTTFPSGNVGSFFTTTFTGNSLAWRVGPSTATVYKTETLCPVPDCKGVLNGPNKLDLCGVCDSNSYNDNSTCKDCAGTPNGQAVKDECGVCNGDGSSCKDCAGVTNGKSEVDLCGICGGDNSSCKDCAGTPNGQAYLDQCGVCNGDGSTCAGCDGVPNSEKEYDQCEVCGGDGSSCQDCAGIPNGQSVIDACGVCGGDSSTCKDCAGTPNGEARLDECGVCNGDGSSCKCPVVAVDYDVLTLVTQLKTIANEKTIEYYSKGHKCRHKKLAKKISSALKSLDKANKSVLKAVASLDKAVLSGNAKKIAKAQKALVKAQAKVAKYLAALAALYAQDGEAESKIVIVQSLLTEYIELANSLPFIVEVCPGECIDEKNKPTLDRMSEIVELVYDYASDAQHSYRGFCKVSGKGNKGTRPLADKLKTDIDSCHGKDKVCR